MLVSIPSKPAITTKIVIIRNTVSNCPWCAIDQPEQHLVVWQARLHALALAGALFIVVAVFKHGGTPPQIDKKSSSNQLSLATNHKYPLKINLTI